MIRKYEEIKQAELKVRDLLNERCYELELNKNELGVYDIRGTDLIGDEVIVEVKLREKKYDTWILELQKANNMIKQHTIALYCCIYNNTYQFYDVYKIIDKYEIKTRNLPAETYEKFHEGEWIEKEIYEFNAEDYEFEIKE